MLQSGPTAKARNCQRVLEAIFQANSTNSDVKCHEFSPYLTTVESSDVNEREKVLINLEVIRLHSKSLNSTDLYAKVDPGYMLSLLGDLNPAIRYRAARFLASYASMSLPNFLNAYYRHMEEAIAQMDSDYLRCGAVELLVTLANMGELLLGVASFLSPLALGAISDPVESVRNGATVAFGKFVSLLSLERVSQSCSGNIKRICALGILIHAILGREACYSVPK